jgi:hypothetical protein
MVNRLVSAFKQAFLAFVMGLLGWEPSGWVIKWPGSYINKFTTNYHDPRMPSIEERPAHWCLSSGGVTWSKEHPTAIAAARWSKNMKSKTTGGV